MSKEQLHQPPALAPPNPDRTRNAKGHKPTCICTLCTRIQARIAAGKPPKSTEAALRAMKRTTRAVASSNGTTLKNRRERRISTESKLEGAIATQVATGQKINIAQAARIAGIDPSQATKIVKESDSVQAALAKNGITLELLDQVGLEGLHAKETRLVIEDGEVIEAIEMPDYHARHKYWRDYNMMHGRLGSEREAGGGTGGLMIILPEQARVVPGHSPACSCQECAEAWNERTKKLQQQALRSMAIDVEIAQNPKALPDALPDESDDFDDDPSAK